MVKPAIRKAEKHEQEKSKASSVKATPRVFHERGNYSGRLDAGRPGGDV
jgi:hypothetical protein